MIWFFFQVADIIIGKEEKISERMASERESFSENDSNQLR